MPSSERPWPSPSTARTAATVGKTVTLRPDERATLDVRRLALGLATLHGVTLRSTDGQGFVAEQTMFAPNLTTLRTTQGLAQ